MPKPAKTHEEITDKPEAATALAVVDSEPEAEQEEKREPLPQDKVVYWAPFSGNPSTAFIDKVNKDGTVDLVAFVLAEQPPVVRAYGIPFSDTHRPGAWNWK